MPKHGFLTPKAIANRIKSKGLQKLRWYCQMCQKQCRDENGFKCHTMSESHQRQLLLFAENPDRYIDSFSEEFLDTFVDLLKRRFGTRRVQANQVYQEYISDRNHLHMNSTQWETLTEFVKWLGREGHCAVDETEKGWFVTYIDRDPETLRRQELAKRHEKIQLDREERMNKFFEKQLEKDKEKSRHIPEPVYTELKKESEEDKVAFTMKTATKVAMGVKDNPFSKAGTSGLSKKSKETGEKRKSALEEIMEQSKSLQEKKLRRDAWLVPGIVVKIMSNDHGENLFKKKAVVESVKDICYGKINVIDNNKKLCVHQCKLETVIPAIGRKVLVLKGPFKGSEGILKVLNIDSFSVDVEIISGPSKGNTLRSMAYEDVSKIYSQ